MEKTVVIDIPNGGKSVLTFSSKELADKVLAQVSNSRHPTESDSIAWCKYDQLQSVTDAYNKRFNWKRRRDTTEVKEGDAASPTEKKLKEDQ